MKRNPRKVKWTKAFRAAHGKDMTKVRVHLSKSFSLFPWGCLVDADPPACLSLFTLP